MNRLVLLFIAVCLFPLCTWASNDADACRNLWGINEFPQGWGLSSAEAVGLAQKSAAHREQMGAAVKAIQLFNSAPAEFVQLLAAVVPAFKSVNEKSLAQMAESTANPIARKQIEILVNERWQITGLATIARVMKFSAPTWTRRLELADVATKDWLTHAAMTIPKLQMDPMQPGVAPGQQIMDSLEHFLEQQDLPSGWLGDFANHSSFVRDQLARTVIGHFKQEVDQSLSDADQVALRVLAREFVDIYFDELEQKRPDLPDNRSHKVSWMIHRLTDALENLLQHHPNLQRENFATIIFLWASQLSMEAEKDHHLLVVANRRMLSVDDLSDRILNELEKDRLKNSRSIPILFSCMLASACRVAKWPTPDQAKRYFADGVRRQLRQVQSP